MAGSACYNIVYMSERVGTSNTYRVTGGDRAKQEETIALWLRNTSFVLSFLSESEQFIMLHLLVVLFCNHLLCPVGLSPPPALEIMSDARINVLIIDCSAVYMDGLLWDIGCDIRDWTLTKKCLCEMWNQISHVHFYFLFQSEWLSMAVSLSQETVDTCFKTDTILPCT